MKKGSFILTTVLMVLLVLVSCQQPLDMSAAADANAKGTYPAWSASATYNGGDRVDHAGHDWEAKWWTTGEEPGKTGEWGVWKDLGPNGGTPATATPTTAPATATPTTVPATATPTTVPPTATVTTVPATATPTSVVATPTATSGTGTPSYPAWDSTKVYVGGDKVTHANHAWNAKWWNQGATPGQDSVWEDLGPATTDPNATPTPTPMPTMQVGDKKILTDAEINDMWGGIDPNTLPNAMANVVSDLLTQADFEALFPRRFGSQGWKDYTNKTDAEYYRYVDLIEAVKELATFKLRVETKNYAQRVFRLNKLTKEMMLLKQDADYTADWLANVTPKVEIADYGLFLNEGTLVQKKQDLAAFLANISHETTGGWDTAPGGRYAWGLYYKQEVNHDDNSVGGYAVANADYPPYANESYHGRGPIQLSYNYNYGYMSQIIFGDKNILLQNPDSVAHDGKLGFMTGVWFWMTPQSPKPACHDVMVGNWVPTAEDIAENRLPGFGVTINVINGGLEAGKPNDYRVVDRIGFYETICNKMGIPMGDNVDCYTQQPF